MKTLDNFLVEKLHIDDKANPNQKPKRDDPDQWKVGDIVTAVFHYSMTLVEFYEIIKATGKSFTFKKLKQKIVSGNGMQGACEPILGEYDERDSKPVTARINKWGSVKIRDYYCHWWDGKPENFDHLD